MVVVGADTETMCGVLAALLLVSELSVVLGRGMRSSAAPGKVREGEVFWLLCLDSDSGLLGRLSPSER